ISKIYKDIYLLIAGPDNEGYGEKIKKLIKNYGIEDKVIFTGPLYGKEKISAFKNAEIFVLPSYSENFGLAVLEAMACGKPCVISNKVGIYKEVKKYNAGIIVETNSRSLYNGIQILLKDENLKRKISENAKKIVKNEYDIEKVAEKMIKVYEDILRK
ncbi:MAG: glycosyltransferase, partial [candidate division WOR-3 bacterium]